MNSKRHTAFALLAPILTLVVVLVFVYYSKDLAKNAEQNYSVTNTQSASINQASNASTTIKGADLKPYSSTKYGFEVNYPKDFAVKDVASFGVLGRGISFVVPATYTKNTNLSPDSRIHVEVTTDTGSCRPALFLSNDTNGIRTLSSVKMGDKTFIGGYASDPAAGNLYEQTIYTTSAQGRCYGITLYVRSGNIANYESNIKAYNSKKLDEALGVVLSSFTIIPVKTEITTPSKSDVWYKGFRGTIAWKPLLWAPKVSITLRRDSDANNVYRIVDATAPNTGLVDWEAPTGIPEGNDYRIYINQISGSYQDTTISDQFTITAY